MSTQTYDNMVFAVLSGETEARDMTWIREQLNAPSEERHKILRALHRLLKAHRVLPQGNKWIAKAPSVQAQA